MKITTELIQLCDRDIRSGHPQKVTHRLAELNTARVAREFRLPLAKICRRAGLYTKGLLLLSPLLQSLTGEQPTPSEFAEYAALLMRNGTVTEAMEKLERVDVTAAPEALLYMAYAHFLNWRFQDAVPVLEKYLSLPHSQYALSVGQANLAFALVEARQHQAVFKLTDEIIRNLNDNENQQLQGSCYALRAQCWIQERNFLKARAELERGVSRLQSASGYDHFSMKKWALILEGLESQQVGPLTELTALAIKHHDWESRREADLYSLLVEFSGEKYVHLYFGSPLAGFRERMQVELGSIPNREIYVLGQKAAPRLDLRTGELNGADCGLNPGKKNHQLLQALLADFYRPVRIGGLFSVLFPREYFDAATSPGRVHQVLRRARSWLASEGIPVEIAEADEFYSLKITGNFSFRIPLKFTRVDSFETQLERLSAAMNSDVFSMKNVCERLAIAETTAIRLLKWAIVEGRIEKSGKAGRTILYRILASADSRAA